ncbi:MAG TPA: amidohydrolase family protein [Pyrinomonadaceae bacterium]|nr:amidohydrolase family protein [Pyrinomonadaceae bacterium]
MQKIYSARWVLPISSAVVEDGAVAIEGSQIASVGPCADVVAAFPNAPHESFSDAAILPGLVNTHSHLELTALRGFLEREEDDFFAWLRKLTIARLKMNDDDLFVSATCGAIEAARAGVTCLGDSSSFAMQSMRALREIGLRGIVYQESFGPDPRVAAENVAKLRVQLDGLRETQTNLVRAGVSPHAPYTVSSPQLEMISRLAIDEDLPLMMHAAESQAEQKFVEKGTGPFAEGLKARGIEWQAPCVSTIEYLRDRGILETRPLLAHCINVNDDDLQVIKNAHAGIAHCPKSNAKLGHGRARFASFIKHEINVGLGSDSVASNNLCDIFEEARFAALLSRLNRARNLNLSGRNESSAQVSGKDALFAATLGGARALGLGVEIGSLEDGKAADIVIVNFDGAHQQPVSNPCDALIFSSSGRDVLLTMVAGKEIYRGNRVAQVDEKDLNRRLTEVRMKLEKD